MIWTKPDEPAMLEDISYPNIKSFSNGFGINNLNNVVGEEWDGAQWNAFYWTNELGMLNINDLVAETDGWHLLTATDISDTGYVYGTAINEAGEEQSYLLTMLAQPRIVPEPATASLLALGVGCLAAARLRTRKRRQ
jgi:hypothetical protein